MTEQYSETSGLKVVSVGIDGKRRFDRQIKRRLVEACLEPGASVAGLALKHGVNANLLRNWIKLHQQRLTNALTQSQTVESAFAPVVQVGSEHAVVAHEFAKSLSAEAAVSTPANRTASSTLAA